MNWLDWVATDPGYGVVWWQIDADGLESAREQLDRLGRDAELVLQITQRGATGPRSTQIPLDTWSGERIVMFGEPGAEHHAAIGLRAGGFFASIARAASLTAPAHRRGPT